MQIRCHLVCQVRAMELLDLQPLAFSNEPEYTKEELEKQSRKRKLKEKSLSANKTRKPNRVGNTLWCLCKKCIPMDTARKSVCCMEHFSSGSPENSFGHEKCVTDEEDFDASILNRTTLKISWVQKDMLRCKKNFETDLTK